MTPSQADGWVAHVISMTNILTNNEWMVENIEFFIDVINGRSQ